MKDNGWKDFSEIFLEDVVITDDLKKFANMVGEQSLAVVIMYFFPKNYEDWMQKEIPALGGKKPIDCIGDKDSLEELKNILMRMH